MLRDSGPAGMKPEMSRRDFIKGCTIAAAALGLSDSVVPQMVEAAASKERPPVVWLHFQECTADTETPPAGLPSRCGPPSLRVYLP